MEQIKNIPLASIEPSPLNPRKTFDKEALQELADNILQHGLLQPITVRPIAPNDTDPVGHFEIVCGERRYRAFKLNLENVPKFTNTIPCIVREMNDEDALDAMITENLQRQDVDPIEEAFAFGQLVKTGKSIEEIALRFGKSKRFIAERIKLDNLLPELKKWVTKGWMNIGAAIHIAKLTEADQKKFYNEYDEEGIGDETDPITMGDAERFTDELFMLIERADWPNDFEGSCGTTCEKCPFNDANVGCLFYEMKPHNASCTNRERWNAKRASWLMQIVKDNADVLVKEGESLETGKTVVVTQEQSPWSIERAKDYQPTLDAIKAQGYKIVKKEEIFERYSNYREDDERLKEKLANNEVYRCLLIDAGWRGTEITTRYFEWKKETEGENKEQVDAMQLVNTYRENIRKSAENKSNRLRTVLNEMKPDELSKDALTANEALIFMILILRRCSHKFRDLCGVGGYQAKKTLMDYVLENKEQSNQIMRDFMREVLGGSDVTWSTDLQQCQSLLLQEWAKDKVDEVEGEYAAKLAKKQAKIEEKLAELGYDTEGKKLDEIPRF